MKRIGFGQVEPNHLSAQRNGQIYAQLPANKNIKILENGQFAKYDYENGEVNFTGDGEWMLVFNEVKLYDDRWRETYKDYAMQEDMFTSDSYIYEDENGNKQVKYVSHNGVGPLKGQMVPRLFKTSVGDIYTTNCIKVANTAGNVQVDMGTVSLGMELGVNGNGYLEDVSGLTGYNGPIFKVVKVYTMPDGQDGVKLQRIS